MSIEQLDISTTEYNVTIEDGSNVQTLEVTEGITLDLFLSEMGIQGPSGADGTSIASIAKTSTVGLVDTYTITLSDSSTQTFTVTNGADGDNGRGIVSVVRTSGTGAQGTTDTYTITYTDSTTSTFTVYNGANGLGSVSSVAMTVPTGLDVSGSPITSSGTLAVTYEAGYAIPTIAKQTNWDTAYGWGNHASAGYVTPTGVQTLTNKTISGALLNGGYTEEVFAVSGTTPALSPTNASIQTWTLTDNSTPTAGTWTSGQSMTLMIDDGSAYTINWASLGVTWKTGGGLAPALNTSGYTVIALWKVGTVIYGARVGDA